MQLLLNSDIVAFFQKLLDTSDFMARWHCGQWSGFHGWLYIISNLLIFAAYFTIPALIYYYVRKKTTIQFKALAIWFILFIFFCGSTHLVDAIIFWFPVYRFNALLLICTAIVSWATIMELIRVLPIAFTMKTNNELEQIINKRTYEVTHQKQNLEDFSQIVSHNLRAPLTSMHSLIDLYDLKDDPIEKHQQVEKLKIVLAKMSESIDNVSEVVNWQLEEVKSENLSITDVFNEVMKIFKDQIANQQIQLDFKCAVKNTIFYPRLFLESIFINLISNAIKYRNPKTDSFIHIAAKPVAKESKNVVLVFKDNGLGIDLEKYGHKVFKINQVFHGNADARGIGLYLLKRHIELVGGTIDIKSKVNEGTSFEILLRDQTE
jgi:chemotaxis family two-component system sensor kinase Cph1